MPRNIRRLGRENRDHGARARPPPGDGTQESGIRRRIGPEIAVHRNDAGDGRHPDRVAANPTGLILLIHLIHPAA